MVCGDTVGDFVLEQELGRGGMGVVFRAWQPGLKRRVALKVIAPELAQDARLRERFLHEAEHAAAVEHPHVVPVYEAGERDSVLYLAMRLVDGLDLLTLVRTSRALAPVPAAAIVGQVAGALQAAHVLGLVHRDVKPHNVLVTDDGHAYLSDFGLAHALGEDRFDGGGAWGCTIDYAAPEVLRGEPASAAADIYALGCVLYEVVSGHAPFPVPDRAGKVAGHLMHPPPRLGIPALDSVIARAMAKQPGDRFGSAAELATALAATADSGWRRASASPSASTIAPGTTSGSSLPRLLAPTFGRERDIEQLRALLPNDRLVTLVGPGGVGKTRLAIEAAHSAAGDYGNGAVFVGLAPLRSSDDVPGAVAQALDVQPVGQQTVDELISRRLAGGETLLVMDNFEQVLGAAPWVAELLASLPDVSVLATSREGLRLSAERVYEVEPLPTPEHSDDETAASRLFLERMGRHTSVAALTAEDRAAVVAICRRLDGLPLALELAAARTALLTPAELARRLRRSLQTLSRGSRDAPDRQRTLRATISWSHELLEPPERRAFAAFAAFAGGADVEAAVAVTGENDDALIGLVEKHLLRRDRQTARLIMLETVREFAVECLAARSDAAAVNARHAQHYLELAADAEAALNTRAESRCFARLDPELDNLRAALTWTVAHDAETAIRLAGMSSEYLWLRGHRVEACRWLDAALALDAPVGSDRARALMKRVYFGEVTDLPLDRALAYAEEARLHHEADCDAVGLAEALSCLAYVVLVRKHDTERALAYAEQAREWAGRSGDDRAIAHAAADRVPLLPVEEGLGELPRATMLLERNGDVRKAANLLGNMVYSAIVAGRIDAAQGLVPAMLEHSERMDEPYELHLALGNAGLVALFSEQLELARSRFGAMLEIVREHHLNGAVREGLDGIGAIAAREGRYELSARLHGASDALEELTHDPVIAKRLDDDYFSAARAALGADRWAAEHSLGTRLSVADAVDLCVQHARAQ